MLTWRYAIALGVLAGLGACSDTMGYNGTSHTSTAATAPTVSPEMVKQVQAKLRANGYYKQGNVDGVWGLGTENAVRSFQQSHNLGSSGQLNVPTLQALNVTSAPAATNGAAPNPNSPASANGSATSNPGAPANDTNNPGTPTQPSNANPATPPADNTAPGPSR